MAVCTHMEPYACTYRVWEPQVTRMIGCSTSRARAHHFQVLALFQSAQVRD